ncbi:MAG TPA: hypothetical protein VHB20_15560 [Verrucomicrobiae bacterium]|jgi:hypothetical protein|nr:hypothetical protein [Verrucomicrobiae bacterium]
MSARRTDSNAFIKNSKPTQCLTLSAAAVRVRKNGIEFRHNKPMEPWTEMILALQGPDDPQKIECQGVIVACDGNARQGYLISMLFTNLTPQTRVRLLAYS